jgi:hypothetical protein
MRKTIIGLALLTFGASGAASAQTGWRVSEASGDVRVALDGQTRPVTRGMLLASGAVVASNPGGRAVLVNGRDYVILSPASRVRLPGAPAQVIPASGGRTMAAMTQVVSEAGTALYRIEHRATPHFRVQTPYLAAVVKGTVFSVTVNRSGASVQVTQGAVEVSTVDGGAAELVRPGMVATVGAGDLLELNIQGDVNRSIRSSGAPLPGVATVPVAEAGNYSGPAEEPVEIAATVHEDPVSLSDTTGGLVSGQGGGVDLALANVRDGVHRGGGNGGTDNSGQGNNNSGGNSGSSGNGGATGCLPGDLGCVNLGGSGSNNGNGNGGSGNNGGNGGGNTGNGGGNGAGDPGNNSGGGGSSGSGSGSSGSGSGDNSGSGSNSGGGSGDNSGSGGSGDNSGSGSSGDGGGSGGSDGSDDSGSGSGNGGGSGHGGRGGGNGGLNICLPGDLLCIGLGGRPH